MTHTLIQLPRPAGLYLGALRSSSRKPGQDITLPALSVRVAALQADASRLAAYRRICGFAESAQLPITFPQVQAAPLHLWLMLRPEFPLPLKGLVHLRNRFQTLQPMDAQAAYEVCVSLAGGRRTHQGFEFDILTEYFDAAGQIVHRALMTPLYRMKSPDTGAPRPKPAAPAPALAQYRSFDVPGDIGRRYAPIGGDFNPIHLSALSAKAFGFPRAIAHGMWSLARAVALLEDARGSTAREVEVQFRQPLLLPAKVALKYQARAKDTDFALLSRTSDKLHLSGALR